MRKNNPIICIGLIFLFLVIRTNAQELLSAGQAVEIALKNNFSILIAKSQADITANDVTPGNAGMLPQVGVNASGSRASNDTKQFYSVGTEIVKSGVGSTSINAGVNLNWTVFDGMKMFATYDKLKELKTMGELSLKVQIENTMAGVISAYYGVVKQKQMIRAISQSIELYEERRKIAETKFKIGAGSKLDVMQAETDINAERSRLIQLQTVLYNAKSTMNRFLSRAPEQDFEVADSIPLGYEAKYDDLKNLAEKQNADLLFAEKNTNISNYALREIQSLRYPKFGVNANYNYVRSANQAGFILLNQNLGFNFGFTASWNLFNGFEVHRQVKDFQIQTLISKQQYEQSKIDVQTNIAQGYKNFLLATELLKLEDSNTKLAKEVTDIAMESFRSGKISSIELKTVQTTYDDAVTRLVNARYNAKVAETELMRLSGQLVK